MPLTRFCVYWTTSEKRKAKAAAETSEVLVLLSGRSYMLGRAPGLGVDAVWMDGADGRENREVEPAGERCSAEDREELERTEKRDGACA